MKKWNKYILNALIVVCLLCLLGITSFAEQDTETTVSFNDVTGAPGDIVELILTASNLPDTKIYLISNWNIDEGFSKDPNNIVSFEIQDPNGGVKFYTETEGLSWIQIGNVNGFKSYSWKDGELAKIKIKIPEDMEEGVYPIDTETLTADYLNVLGYADPSLKEISAIQKPGSITVKKAGSSSETKAYNASLVNTVTNSVAPGKEFEVPVVITSDFDLAAAELNFSCTNAEIIQIKESDLEIKDVGESVSCFIPSIEEDGQKAKLTFCGNTASPKTGLKVAILKIKAGETGTAIVKLNSGKAIANGETGVDVDESGTYIFSDGTDITVPQEDLTVQVVPAYTVEVVDNYAPGFALIRCNPTTELGGMIPAYDGKAMFSRSYTDNSVEKKEYLYLVTNSELTARAEQGTLTVSEDKISLLTAEPKDLSSAMKGDLNGSNTVNIVDAQIAFDLSKGTNGKYNIVSDTMTSSTVDMLHWLLGDVNSDYGVTALDARAIMVYLHTQDWNKNLPAA